MSKLVFWIVTFQNRKFSRSCQRINQLFMVTTAIFVSLGKPSIYFLIHVNLTKAGILVFLVVPGLGASNLKLRSAC